MIPAMSLIEDQLSFYNVRRSGANFDASTLLLAIEDLGNIECVAYLPKGLEDEITIWLINQDVTFPANISVLIPCGVVLQVQSGITLTFEGPCFNQCANWSIGLGTIVLNSKSAINSQSYSDFFGPFVVNGGIHGLSPTCSSPDFFTEAYVSNGQYIREPSTSINYGALGANCLSDTVYVVISNLTSTAIPGTNFIRVPDTSYYIDFVSTSLPTLPLDSGFLMEVTLLDDTIVKVNDLRALGAPQGLFENIKPVSWTPLLLPGSYLYTANTGYYMRFGQLVTISGHINLNSITSLGSGVVQIANLPFEDYIYSFGGFNVHYLDRLFKPSSGPSFFAGFIYPNETKFTIVEMITGRSVAAIVSTRVKRGTIIFGGTYFVNL